MNKNVWIFKSCENIGCLIELFSFLNQEYCRIFGVDTMRNESCVIYNDTNTDIPMLITNENPIQIRLAQKSLKCWAQTVFQLSHELCHYAIRQHKKDKNFTLFWFEEIVCEAMSLYALQFASENWDQCKLSKSDPTYSTIISNYLKEQLNMSGTEILHRCTTVELLKEYERNHRYDRETHQNERDSLYYAISICPDDCRFFCDYTNYINEESKVTIDFFKWENDNLSQIIKELHKLQPC